MKTKLRGRPTKYKEEYNLVAENACKYNGFDDKKLAKLFDTTEVTINAWKKEHPEFLKSIKRGKDKHDVEKVEISLLQRALGYEHEEIIFFSHKGVVTDQRTVIKHYPPDTAAAFIWLKNRHPERWKDKQTIEHEGLTVNIIRTDSQPKAIEVKGQEVIEEQKKIEDCKGKT